MTSAMRNGCRLYAVLPAYHTKAAPFSCKKAVISIPLFSRICCNNLSSFHDSITPSSPSSTSSLYHSCSHHSLLTHDHLTSALQCTYSHNDHYPLQIPRRFYRTQAPMYYSTPGATVEASEPFGRRILKFVGWMGGFYSQKQILGRAARSLYESSIDNIDCEKFFKVCCMPDNFQSWFLVAHLHVWLLMVRLKREGKDGECLIKQLVITFWEDVDSRMRLLGVHSSKVAYESKREFLQQFYGITIAYEEGLLSSDKVLAAAIWRNLVGDYDQTDPVQLAKMVEYIRKQVLYMDKLDSAPLIETGTITLLPL